MYSIICNQILLYFYKSRKASMVSHLYSDKKGRKKVICYAVFANGIHPLDQCWIHLCITGTSLEKSGAILRYKQRQWYKSVLPYLIISKESGLPIAHLFRFPNKWTLGRNLETSRSKIGDVGGFLLLKFYLIGNYYK